MDPAETIRDPGMVGTLRNSHIPGKEGCTVYLARMLGVLGRPRVTGGRWLARDESGEAGCARAAEEAIHAPRGETL